MFTRKHYEFVANLLRKWKYHSFANNNAVAQTVIDAIAGDLADMFIKDNPRFNPRKFLEAAGTVKFSGPVGDFESHDTEKEST